ncbi:hypothetical protein L1286_11170 [Pseudoalteromonas sp. SMS1]|uniref:hypothetical protein n=1 Tax=Pseudoalteromonas sp. SMS1 TaxID=2908894 RepID=UPI001F37E977|nr:hypothetical protein [Pseudoalteromonas sp. SMS1]MCF2858033.1 hypothetical protein [Pseudoalteromonas sp. SMS1]
MANLLRKKLKSFFKRGAKPTESQFATWIEACLLLGEDGVSKNESGIEISKSLTVRGNLVVDGTFWLSEGAPSQTQNMVATQVADTPTGAICLWYGEVLPSGYRICDGQDGRPLITPPKIQSGALNYIIKTV